MKLLFILLLPLSAMALDLAPGESIDITCGVGDCPEPEFIVKPVNEHAVLHSHLGGTYGPGECLECHSEDSDTPALTEKNVGLCSEYDFQYPGIPAVHPVTGEIMTDPVTDTQIISGGKVAIYNPGMLVECQNCHFPHGGTREDPEKEDGHKVEDFMVHAGCLGAGCHRRVGSGDEWEEDED